MIGDKVCRNVSWFLGVKKNDYDEKNNLESGLRASLIGADVLLCFLLGNWFRLIWLALAMR